MTVRLRLLGSFGLTDDGGNDVLLGSPRAQSLLAYLALHRDAPSSRRQVAFDLWPDSPEAQARNSLRQLLHQVRQAWPDAGRFLVADAGHVALVPGMDLVVDIDAYEAAVAEAMAADAEALADDGPPDGRRLRLAFEHAADLYRGDLLPGSYDDWVVPRRDRLAAGHQRTLDRLVGLLERQGDYRAAIDHGQRRLRLDPLDEHVHRWLMRLHALNQDRAGAIRVYRACEAVLRAELGVEPDALTVEAYEQVLRAGSDGSWPGARAIATGEPREPAGPAAGLAPLIGRRREWATALETWRRMSAGEAGFLIVSGEAGIGKSRLAAELGARAVAEGMRSALTRAYAAEGRLSFAPVADWLRSPALAQSLPRLDAGSLSEVSRLLPELLDQRPDLPRPSARIEDWQRQAFFGALARAVTAGERPLLLILDDLQWCDADSLAWLHFLLRSDRAAPVLVVGTVRPEEVDRAHPLVALVAAIREAGQLTEIVLGPLDPSETASLATQAGGRPLTAEQAGYLQRETEGNPLFVVETVRAGLVEPGGSRPRPGAADAPGDGHASLPPRLPPKVQAVIATRLAQLTPPARQLAAVAATVGRAFTLDVVEDAGGVDDDVLVGALDELLGRQIIREQGTGAYDFTHDKIREVAYAETTDAHRRLLHRRVAASLEHVYAARLEVVAARIAAHHAHAGQPYRAAEFFRLAAEGEQRVGANQEAIALLQRGLALLDSLPPSRDRDARELDLRTVLGVSLVATEGYGASAVASVYTRCRQLCQVLGRPPGPPILRALALASLAQAKIDDCHALGDHLLSVAERANDPLLRVEAHYVIAMALLLTGAAVPARKELEASLAHYDRSRSATHIALYSQDPGVVCRIRLSLDLWLLGDTEGSAQRRAESLDLARDLAHPFTLGYALTWDAILQCYRGDAALAATQAEAAIGLGRDHRMPFWLSIATIIHGWAIAEQGDGDPGVAEMRRGMADFTATGSMFLRPFQLGLLAEQHGRLGNAERGLTLIAEALSAVERTNERWCEPELYRRLGELQAMTSDPDAAEASFVRAVAIARYQEARALELRAAMRLAELQLGQGRRRDATQLLGPIVGGLGEATDLADLDRARLLLGRASSHSGSPRA